jgi:glycosyltransferase involved in cell wall biosynthesis
MLNGKKIVVVLPAYNAARTLERTWQEIPLDVVDEVLLVDDASRDETVELARRLGITTIVHERNRGYGGNQKTCYRAALDAGADIVVMLHPDYQYTPRILGPGALKGGMPLWRYAANRFLTLVENILLGQKLSEYHTGYRAFSREVLERLPLERNSDDFVFDNQVLVQIVRFGYRLGELSCPTRYFAEASSINFSRSVIYGMGVLRTAFQYRLQRWGVARFEFLSER